MKFTEKKFAHLPARESQHKEAPYPKSKKIEKKADDNAYIDVEDKDPLWLKDKGDHFYRRNDFYSALNAYSKSLQHDKDFLMCMLNRATTFMRTRMFTACIDECDEIQQKIKALPEAELKEDEAYYTKLQARSHLKRGAAYAWCSQYDAAIYDLKKAMEYKGIFTEEETNTMSDDIDTIELRKKSQEIKLQGDILFARNMLNESLEAYFKALELEPTNEYAMSNIGVIYLKRQDYDNCEKFSTMALEVIDGFHADTREFQNDNTLEIKLLQRRAKCLEVKEDFEKAKEDLDRAHMLDKENPVIRTAKEKVQ